MVQGFYTLDEAAKHLGMAPEELNRMAQKREVRAFADRGTWRFRTQDIEELGRRRAAAAPPAAEEDDLSLTGDSDANLEIGQELVTEPKPSSKSGPKKSGPKAKTEPGESDIRLVVDDEFELKLADDDAPAPTGKTGMKPKSGVKPKSDVHPPVARKSGLHPEGARKSGLHPEGGRKSGLHPEGGRKSGLRRTGLGAPPRQDSGLRLAPLPGEESDVKLGFDSKKKIDDSMVLVGEQSPAKPQDSDVRLDLTGGPPRTGVKAPELPADEDAFVSEEMDLESAPPPAKKSKSKLAPKAKTKPPELPKVSPFELSESDLDIPGLSGNTDSSFDLALDEDATVSAEDEVELGELETGDLSSKVGLSGIHKQASTDSGVGLEQGGDDDFDLSLDAEEAAPAAAEEASGDSDFELSLDEGDLQAPVVAEEAPEGEKDIFETDFELPALDAESASEAVPLEEADTDLESSDFDLSREEDSGSEVLSLEEDLAEEEAPAPKKKKKPAAAEEEGLEGSIDELLSDEAMADVEAEAEEEEEEEPEPVLAGAAPPAPWGVVPLLALVPSVLILLVAGMMGYELLHNMWGYQQASKTASPVLRAFANMFTDEADLPKE